MTQARKTLVDPTHAANYHCVARCVRRAWLCGFDTYARKSFEHRRPWVERRILALSGIFACGIYAYAVMSNHYHLVVHMSLRAGEVAASFPRASGGTKSNQLTIEPEYLIDEVARKARHYGKALKPMKSISEPIARRANAEDKVNGRFWQGRFKCQLLRDERVLLAAMTYVDLNPIRANIAPGLNRSKHTSVRQRYRETLRTQEMPACLYWR